MLGSSTARPADTGDGTLHDDSLPTRDLDQQELEQARSRSGALQIGDLLDGKFELTGVLGSGGMGTVYRARDRHLDREVAIKMIHSDKLGDPSWVDRFLAEARTMARVHHPNVVMIHAFGSRHGHPYLVMEHIPGENLAMWRRRRGALDPAASMEVLDALCRGVQAIHDVGAVHRDLKPSNVLIDPQGRVVITDFGLARSVDEGSEDGHRMLAGTPAYLAPEIARGDVPSPEHATAIDVYALSVMAFELLTGMLPFRGPTLSAMIQQHAHASPPDASTLCPSLSSAFDAPLRRGLAKAPQDRPASAEALRLALQAAFATTTDPRSRRVLLVDDEANARSAVADLLALSFPGIEVLTAADATEAIAAARRSRPDIVIADLQMPGGGGMALTRALRNDDTTRDVPIVVVTAHGGALEWRALKQRGADRFLVKPLDFDTLASTVRSLTGWRGG